MFQQSIKSLLIFTVFLATYCPSVTSQIRLPIAPYITDLRGDPCRDNETCLTRYSHSFCKFPQDQRNSEGACHCEKGYVSSSNRSRCLAADVRLGGSCEENQQCSSWETSTAVCLTGSGVCDCAPGFIPSDDLTLCLPVVNVLGTVSCQEDAQCQLGKPGTLSKCTKRSSSSSDDFLVCKCQSDAVNAVKDNKCYHVAEVPGDQCTVQAQCTVGLKHSRCIDKQCQCNKGYQSEVNHGKNTCAPKT